MNLRRLAPALALLASACTFAPQDNTLSAGFHPPIVAKHWDTKNYTLPNGLAVCAISSGYNGLTVTLSHPPGGEDVLIQSTRLMQPSAELTVNAGGRSFETYDAFFPPKMSHALLDSLATGGSAYLEWSEFSGPVGRERIHIQNTVALDDFRAKLKECRDSLRPAS